MIKGKFQTGPYTHGQGMREDIRFPTASQFDRNFSVVLANGSSARPNDPDVLGFAILDNDNARVVVDGLRPLRGVCDEDSPAAMVALQAICMMSWEEFSKMCRSSPRYRGGIPDIDELLDIPLPGNPESRQVKQPTNDACPDIRTGLMKEIHKQAFIPYNLPPRSRIQAEIEIRNSIRKDGDKWGLSWDLTPSANWNRTGQVEGGRPVSKEFDHDWRVTVTRSSRIVSEAIRRLASPYVSEKCEILDMGPGAVCHFEMSESPKPRIILVEIAGTRVRSVDRDAIIRKISTMTDDDLAHIWATNRVMKSDLSDENLRQELALHMSDLRFEFETGKMPDHLLE